MSKGGRVICFLLLSVIYFLDLGCAGKQINKTIDSDDEVGKDFAERNNVIAEKEVQEIRADNNIYDIEKELPENRELEDVKGIEEKVTPAVPDSFSVEDVTSDAGATMDYSLGYRIQIFASSSLQKAKEIKNQAESEMSLKVYIELDDGMYKVRVGNFNSRKDASEARGIVTSFFPDCWITETTIKK